VSSEPPVDRRAELGNRVNAKTQDSEVPHSEVPHSEVPHSEVPHSEVPHVKVWDAAQILSGSREAIILHGDQAYRLLCTRNGKLILQK
jgi:hemin uptake protein HemP